MWTKLDTMIKDRKTPFSMLDRFKKRDGQHDLATSGKKA
jgi:hypothetical protein